MKRWTFFFSFFFCLSVEGNNICDVQKPLRASDNLDTPLGADSRLNFDEISLEWNIEWIFLSLFLLRYLSDPANRLCNYNMMLREKWISLRLLIMQTQQMSICPLVFL